MTSSEKWDVLVIGGGHNGLACAAILAKAGRKVLLLEATEAVGGLARTKEFFPGFHASGAHLLNRLHGDVIRALELEKYGLKIDRADFAPTVALCDSGKPLVLHGAYGERVSGASLEEETAWQALRSQLLRYAGVLKPLLSRRPPDLAGLSFSDTTSLAKTALALKRLGKEDMRDFLRVILMNVADLIDEQLADDRLKGVLAFDAVLGAHLGPRSPTSLLGLLYRLTGESGRATGAQLLPAGGMGAVITAMENAAQKAGVTIRPAAPVVKILTASGRASSVRLASGEEIDARTIISAINPATTFLDLVGARELETGFVRKMKNIRMKGDVAKLHLALDRVPQFTGVDASGHKGRLVIAPSTDHVERAFNPAKYGEFSAQPVMEITLPSLTDPSLAPGGACVLSANVQYAPYELREGWETGKPKFLKAIMEVLERFAPGIGKSVLHAELLTPVDIEQRYLMHGGHWHHGELQADQMLFSRPVSGWSGYDTPLDGLFLCGAGSHPGGGISGLPGLNAARRIMATRTQG